MFGSGHSFNGGVVSDDTLVSLDDYSGLIWKDRHTKRIAVKGGTRVRDVVKLMFDEGLAFRALAVPRRPEHRRHPLHRRARDRERPRNGEGVGLRQPVGREPQADRRQGEGARMRARGRPLQGGGRRDRRPGNNLRGGGRGRRALQRRTEGRDEGHVLLKNNLDRLLGENDHLSVYLFPFTDRCRINTWNRTDKRRSVLGDLREFVRTSVDALGAAWVGNFLAYAGPAAHPVTPRLRRRTRVQPRAGEQQGLQPDDLPPAPGAGVHGAFRGHLRGLQAVS